MNFELEVEQGIGDIIKNSSEEELNNNNLISFIEDEKIKEPAHGHYLNNIRLDKIASLKEKKKNKRIKTIDKVLQ